ncbi:glycosyl hydrolase [Streptomyces sp. AJS327]|uniref:glycoside hydrolase family 31 protein n=1 Tax=Streptomyces sp. AJS327 TaxID=2545265 RepID=UPI0015DF89A2|nr:glycoside hydrolase family 31 protein [Streptomyces sp. AJS327]MBA0051053.1 glycosyl hydrolase [Streptomyces sp. AJS327]
MDARDLVRSVKAVGWAQGARAVRSTWRRQRADAALSAEREGERARLPGVALEAERRPGGGVVRFARSSLWVRVAVGGAVFCGWDGAGPEPSYALRGACPEPDERAVLEPDTDGGWRVVSERVLVTVARDGVVELRTPGGALLRRDPPPRWWERAEPREGEVAGSRWAQRSEVAADARFFGLGGGPWGPRLRDGRYRMWNAGPGPFATRRAPLSVTMPVQLVVADVGTHLVFHDTTWDGEVALWEGAEGLGSGHDRPGRCEVRFAGGPARYWVIVGPPARVLHGWRSLTGAPAVPPRWALGYQHGWQRPGPRREVRRVAGLFAEHRLPLRALQVDPGRRRGGWESVPEDEPTALARELAAHGVRLVPVVGPAVRAVAENPVYQSGVAGDVFVTGAGGREVRAAACPGESAFPDFTDPRVRKWWAELCAERLPPRGSGLVHDMNEPTVLTVCGEGTLPRSARHALEGRGGDHREAHNVYGLTMAMAGYEGLRGARPDERPFLVSRSGWAGAQRYGGTWSAGAVGGWAGLRAALAYVLGLGLCGVPYVGSDVGGCAGRVSPELYLRWFQLGAYLPLFGTRSARWSGRREPWEFGPVVLEQAKVALAERERLLPYFLTLAQLARRTGAPYARPLWWRHPKDRALRDCEDAFLLGDALLVAPVLEGGTRERTVRLPSGRWYDTATGAAHEGPGEVRVAAPISRIPVLARAGAAVPVAGPDGGVALDVWRPAPGRTGSGLLFADRGDGWERPEAERFVVRLADGETVVERTDGRPVSYPVRVRGG